MRVLFLALLIIGMISCKEKPPRTLPKGIARELPAFKIQMMDTTVKFNTADIPKGKPVVLFFFGPDCPYCQAFTKEIVTRMNELKDVRFYLVSVADFKEIHMYDTLFKLDKYKNVTIGKDMNAFFFTYYKAPGYPYMAVYDKKKEFREIIVGSVGVDSLKKVLRS
ncbi:TlpA family protein disulfide reductase [Chitinophaga agri]|uniref:Thioredoxin fold domain-containing protein n=1 Tax=Chitinophaga agri TaxID=2703787 RepID=A0A6B9ZF89_9BACT|nr:thioredoxin family protein [Chitinophaga agri]QHS61040.1 thioredoxin fold domain-containing protein [Chitinophaga agri]